MTKFIIKKKWHYIQINILYTQTNKQTNKYFFIFYAEMGGILKQTQSTSAPSSERSWQTSL